LYIFAINPDLNENDKESIITDRFTDTGGYMLNIVHNEKNPAVSQTRNATRFVKFSCSGYVSDLGAVNRCYFIISNVSEQLWSVYLFNISGVFSSMTHQLYLTKTYLVTSAIAAELIWLRGRYIVFFLYWRS